MNEQNTVSIVDFFDIHSREHLEAYRHLTACGCWPEGFIPEHVQVNSLWQVALAAKMADAWVQSQIPNN